MFSRVPEELSQMNKLVSIDLSSNKFQEFPDVLQRLPSLGTINLSSNEISEVHTDNFVLAQSLTELNLCCNPLSDSVIMLLQSIVRINIVL